MYTVTLIPGDYAWTDNAVHECDDKGIVKKIKCFKNIQIESKEDYIRIRSIIQQERERKGLIAFHSTSNLWLLNEPTEFGYTAGSFIVPSSFPNIYQLKSDLEKCCQHVGMLANSVCFDPIEYIPTETPRTKTIKVKEPLTHSYSNEIINEYAIWDDTAQDYIIKVDRTYEWCTSNLMKKIEISMVDENNESYIVERNIPIIIEKEITEYEYDPEDPTKILYDIDYNNLKPKYPIKYISKDGIEINKESYQLDPSNNYCAMYVPYVKLSCDCDN
jgi:hypothetical protein